MINAVVLKGNSKDRKYKKCIYMNDEYEKNSFIKKEKEKLWQSITFLEEDGYNEDYLVFSIKTDEDEVERLDELMQKNYDLFKIICASKFKQAI